MRRIRCKYTRVALCARRVFAVIKLSQRALNRRFLRGSSSGPRDDRLECLHAVIKGARVYTRYLKVIYLTSATANRLCVALLY